MTDETRKTHKAIVQRIITRQLMCEGTLRMLRGELETKEYQVNYHTFDGIRRLHVGHNGELVGGWAV